MKIISKPSPNFGPRRHGLSPHLLILHYTETHTLDETLALLQDLQRQTSAHYVVDADGTIVQLVDDKDRAWHAGDSCWENQRDVNSASIGIEIQNAGHAGDLPPFPSSQILAVAHLCQDLIQRHHIRPCHVLGHSDIAPHRKRDPGEHFPWQRLALDYGVGLWPEITTQDRTPVSSEDFHTLLIRYGYDGEKDISLLLQAFCRHFYSEALMENHLLTPETEARLRALIRMKENSNP